MVSNNNEIVLYRLLNEGKYDSVDLNETLQENEIYSRGRGVEYEKDIFASKHCSIIIASCL